MVRLPVTLLVAGALAAAACGGSGDGTEVTASTTLDATTTTTAAVDGEVPSGSTAEVPEELDFVAPDVRGGQVVGADFAGQAMVIWFWAPW